MDEEKIYNAFPERSYKKQNDQPEKPYEIHLVEFETDNDFSNFMQDEERQRFLHLKDKSIKSTFLVKGTKL